MTCLSMLFNPKSIAIIGASDSAGRAGNIIIRNLQSGKFQGPIMPVTPKYQSVAGILAYENIASLPLVPDLAVLCTHPTINCELIHQLGIKGVKLVIVLASEMKNTFADDGRSEFQRMQEIAKKYTIRLIGPNSLGLILPWLNLNASFSPIPATRGNIAFISQSAGVCSTILDWAQHRRIGFSLFISLGETCDIDIHELLDYLRLDSKTHAILIYLENIKEARAFISAARAASRNKRVLVLKSARFVSNPTRIINDNINIPANLPHITVGLDAAYDAAIRRSGMLRVSTTYQLFAALETLSHSLPLRGERLIIVSNSSGSATMAVDTLMETGCELTLLHQQTLSKLNDVLPITITPWNPIDIGGDADIERYKNVLEILLESDDFDALLLLHSPSVTAPGLDTAKALINVLQNHPRANRFTILTNWQGESDDASISRLAFAHAGFPAYRSPESAVTAFMHLVQYQRNKKQLLETPMSIGEIVYDVNGCRTLLQKAITSKVTTLSTHQIRPFLAKYGINVIPTCLAHDLKEATQIATEIGYPVAIKIYAENITQHSNIDGVMLNLNNAAELAQAWQLILSRVALTLPSARIDGFQIQKMADRTGSQKLRLCVQSDPVFGPIILLGEGGTTWNVNTDATVALPPLNTSLARYFIESAITSGKLRQHTHPLDINALSHFIVTLSQIVVDFPEMTTLDIHPLLITKNNIVVLDVSMSLSTFQGNAKTRLAISPYPKELEQSVRLKGNRQILLRPILPEDEPNLKKFINSVTSEDLYARFFSNIGNVNHETLAKLTQIDYDREMAFIAIEKNKNTEEYNSILGVVRVLTEPQHLTAEFAILVRSDLKGLGLGRVLMEKIITYSKQCKIQTISGITMPSNISMISLATKIGFHIDVKLQEGIVEMEMTF